MKRNELTELILAIVAFLIVILPGLLISGPAWAEEVIEVATNSPSDPDSGVSEEAAPAGNPSMLTRSEFTNGELTQSFALIAEDYSWQFWIVGLNKEFADYEIGKEIASTDIGNAHVSLTGYLTHQPYQNQTYFLTWVNASAGDETDSLNLNGAYYIPLGEGSETFFSDSSYTHKLTKEFGIGLDALLWAPKGESSTLTWGPAIQLDGEHMSLRIGAKMFGGDDTTIRADLTFH